MDQVIQFEGTIYEEGYGLLSQKVMRDKTLSRQSKVIYAYMCSFAAVSKNGERTAFPSVSLQCSELGMNEDTYYKWRKKLIDLGYIKIKKQRSDDAKFDRNIYSIVAVPKEIEKVDIDENKPYPKKSGMEEIPSNQGSEPYPNSWGTEKPCTVNSGTNSTSLNKEIKETKETKETEAVFESTILSISEKESKQDQLLKDSLKSTIPEPLHEALDVFSKNYDEMYNWFGIILKAKAKVEEVSGEIILLEKEENQLMLRTGFVNAIRNIRKQPKNNPDNYLFIALKNHMTQSIT